MVAKRNRPEVVELFAGAGLLSYAFAREGFTITRAIELDRTAAETYRRNLGPHVECADVTKAEPVGRCDVLVAGPPCQGFSSLGLMRDDDPRNGLTMHVVRFARAMRPVVVVIENVPRFVRSPVWTRLQRALEQEGYEVQPFVLNALDFGVAQDRERSFTIATRAAMPTIARPRTAKRSTVRDAFDALPGKADGQNQHYAPAPSALALARMRVVPPGGDKRDIIRAAPALAPPSWGRLDHGGCEATDVWGRLAWDRPSNTLRTTLQNPSKGRYIHPEEHRVISLREAARLHSIPDEFTFAGRPYPIARQIGNSVPPLLGRAVARAVRRALR